MKETESDFTSMILLQLSPEQLLRQQNEMKELVNAPMIDLMMFLSKISRKTLVNLMERRAPGYIKELLEHLISYACSLVTHSSTGKAKPDAPPISTLKWPIPHHGILALQELYNYKKEVMESHMLQQFFKVPSEE